MSDVLEAKIDNLVNKVDDLDGKVDDIRVTSLPAIGIEIARLKVKSGFWGAFAGIVTVLTVIALKAL